MEYERNKAVLTLPIYFAMMALTYGTRYKKYKRIIGFHEVFKGSIYYGQFKDARVLIF